MLIPITLVYLLFVLSVFIGEPLSNLLLSCSRFGRLLLTREERRASAWLVGGLVGAATPLTAGLLLGNDPMFFGGVAVLSLLFPAMATFLAPPGRRRTLSAVATAALSVVAVAGFILALTGTGGGAYWLFASVIVAGVVLAAATPGFTLDATRATR